MTAPLDFPIDTLDSWLAELKPYQSATLRQFMTNLSPEAAAEKWLTTIGSQNIVGFGGGLASTDTKPYWEKFKAECRRFICDESAYAEEKKSFAKEVPISKTAIISVMSSAIGAHLGTAGTLVAPAVTIVLFTLGGIGVKAYCAN